MDNFKHVKTGTSKTLKAATAVFVLTTGAAVSSSIVDPDIAQARLGEPYEVYHPLDNPAEESITITAENTQDNPARVSGVLSDDWIGYYTTYEDGETQYMIRNEEGSRFHTLDEGTQTVSLIQNSGDEQGFFDVTATVDAENIDGEPTVSGSDLPGDPDEVPEEIPAEDTTDEGTDDASAEDSTDESADEAPIEDSTDESTEEAPAEDSTDESTEEAPVEDSIDESTEEAPAEASTNESKDDALAESTTDDSTEEAASDDFADESTDDAPTNDASNESTDEASVEKFTEDSTTEAPTGDAADENAGAGNDRSDEVEENATASDEGDATEDNKEITSSEDVEQLPRTGGETAPLSAVGGLMVLLSSAALAFRKKFSNQ